MRSRVVVPESDLGGIGPEVALRVLARASVREACRPVMLGHLHALRAIAAGLPSSCWPNGAPPELAAAATLEAGFAAVEDPNAPLPVVELESAEPRDPPGRPAAAFGFAAVEGVLRGGAACLQDRADALVTPPIHKESMHLAGYPYEGQTQIVGELCGSRRYGMLACAGALRVLVATRHMSLREALARLDHQVVAKSLRLAHEAARETLGIAEPRIALAALNPHAGEGGAFGDDEDKLLRPAIAKVREEYGWETAGPLVPDVVFAAGARGDWDVVVALYHDQAFIPLKMLPREQAYTLFVGGPILRVSPMHGAAYDLARTGRADPEPFAFSLDRALEYAAQRAANPSARPVGD
ncbi:MAG: 4-hydroxythreonine-4-phosphate dehydrogenase PdxA [Planctomycetota bacterium]|nr:4-hydroxythreonine-4-phosphate dehydrogenase PdxA [Planctomycetota bacterium]